MNNLRELRLSKKIKASVLADALSITPKHLYDLENGKRRLNIDHLQALTKELGVTAGEILAETYTVTDPSNKEELKKFIASKGSEPYIILSAKAHKNGISLETLATLIDLYTKK